MGVRSTCPIACALDLVGDSWTLVVLRDLIIMGHRSFSKLATNEGIATNILSDRLKRLEEHGFIARHHDPQDGRRKLIEPTEKAWALAPLLLEVAIFGRDHCGGEAAGEFVEAARRDRAALIEQLRARHAS